MRSKRKEMSKSKGIEVVEQTAEWFVYNEKGMTSGTSNVGVKITTDSITFVTSGVIRSNKKCGHGSLA